MTSPQTRAELGQHIQNLRHAHALSVEDAAKTGGIGHMTWRRIERGGEVQNRSYSGVDRAFGFAVGHTLNCLHTNKTLDSSKSLTASEDAADSESGDEAASAAGADPWSAVFANVENLSFMQLEVLQETVNRMVHERRKLLTRIESNLTQSEQEKQTITFQKRSSFEASPDVAAQYQHALFQYMREFHSINELTEEMHSATTTQPVPTQTYFRGLLQRAEEHQQRLRMALAELADAEAAGRYHRDENTTSEGASTDGMDT